MGRQRGLGQRTHRSERTRAKDTVPRKPQIHYAPLFSYAETSDERGVFFRYQFQVAGFLSAIQIDVEDTGGATVPAVASLVGDGWDANYDFDLVQGRNRSDKSMKLYGGEKLTIQLKDPSDTISKIWITMSYRPTQIPVTQAPSPGGDPNAPIDVSDPVPPPELSAEIPKGDQ